VIVATPSASSRVTVSDIVVVPPFSLGIGIGGYAYGFSAQSVCIASYA